MLILVLMGHCTYVVHSVPLKAYLGFVLLSLSTFRQPDWIMCQCHVTERFRSVEWTNYDDELMTMNSHRVSQRKRSTSLRCKSLTIKLNGCTKTHRNFTRYWIIHYTITHCKRQHIRDYYKFYLWTGKSKCQHTTLHNNDRFSSLLMDISDWCRVKTVNNFSTCFAENRKWLKVLKTFVYLRKCRQISPIGVGAQSTLGARSFCLKIPICVKN